MKVLHVIPSVSLKHGGPSVALPLMERALAQAGVEVTVATTDDDGPGAHLNVPLGQARNGGNSTRFYFRKQSEFYKVSVPLWRWLRDNLNNFDVVHIHALFSFTSVAAARCARRLGVPYIIRPLGVLNRYGMTKRRPALKSLSFLFLEKPLLQHAAAIHYTSHQEKTEAESLFESVAPVSASQRFSVSAFPFSQGVVIPLGLSISEFQHVSVSAFPRAHAPVSPLPSTFSLPSSGREIVLFLSRLDSVKGLDLLIDAFAEVRKRRPSVLLVIAGDGEEAFVRELRHRAETLGIASDILWTGFLDGADKLAALAAARVFVLPSYSENFGVAAVEALAAGIPTVLTTGVGISDDVRQNDAGIVVSPSAAEIASAVERLLADSVLAARVSANAARLARERYSLEAMGRALKALYEEVISKALSGKRRRAKGEALSARREG